MSDNNNKPRKTNKGGSSNVSGKKQSSGKIQTKSKKSDKMQNAPKGGSKSRANMKKPNPNAKKKNEQKDFKAPQQKGKPSSKAASNKKNFPKRRTISSSPIRMYFLGGINEVGKNMTVFEYEDDMIIVDCGLAFPDEDMPGIDLVIPDFTFVLKNADKIKGIVISHGHEDHIGSLAYLLRDLNVPVYSTRLTNGLIEGKLREHNLLDSAKLFTVNPGQHVQLGKFDVEFIHVNHSIPDAVGFAIRCGGGTVVHTGDFKIDTTPIDGGMIDLARFAEIGSEGVLCMLADSTNAERPGYTESERKVGNSFDMLFRKAGDRRIIVATFASNIHRVQQIINTAQSLGRKVALSGRSLENVVNISRELGYLKVPDGIIIDLNLINKYSDNEIVLITTGSQGEPMSALTRMAFSDHRKVAITPNDYVIISATPIPGNEKTVSRVINELMKLGAEVVYERMYDVHVSGHACREELKIMLGIIKPKYFVPVHGERKHLSKHRELAESMGIDRKNIMIVDNGVAVEVSEKEIRKLPPVPAGAIFVDGLGVGDVGSVVIKERKHLAQDGIIIVAFTLDTVSGELISGPDIVSRGFVFVREAEELMEEAKRTAFDAYFRCRNKGRSVIKNTIRDDVSRLMYERTKRSPMILPVLMEI